MCSSPSVPPMPPLPAPPPQRFDPAVAEGADRERRRLLALRGRRASIVTGPLGVTTAPQLGQRQLLGG